MLESPFLVPADMHVHSEWSWDAVRGNMMATCERAAALGLPAIAFTEHADFVPWTHGSPKDLPLHVHGVSPGREGDFDPIGYWECLERCRLAYRDLQIFSGVELGEPHLFRERTEEILKTGPFQHVLGSVHCIAVDGALCDLSRPELLGVTDRAERVRQYLASAVDLIASDVPFTALSHIDYPQRYWPKDAPAFNELDFEEEYREVLRRLALSGRMLEVNTRIGANPTLLQWWVESGGKAVCFGSDAHTPEAIASGFEKAAPIVESFGFHHGKDMAAPWVKQRVG